MNLSTGKIAIRVSVAQQSLKTQDFYLMYLNFKSTKIDSSGIIITESNLYTRFIPADMSLLPI